MRAAEHGGIPIVAPMPDCSDEHVKTPSDPLYSMFFQREMPKELVITGKPCSWA